MKFHNLTTVSEAIVIVQISRFQTNFKLGDMWLQEHAWSIRDRVFLSIIGERNWVSLGDMTLDKGTGGVWGNKL